MILVDVTCNTQRETIRCLGNKNICASKDTIKVKSHTEWEKIFANLKGLPLRICEECLQLSKDENKNNKIKMEK